VCRHSTRSGRRRFNADGAFGIADSVGALAPGMIADLIAVDGDPLTDLTVLQRVRVVIVAAW
jgi:imidazolonepropionase-like amidohydrolase